MDLRATLGLFVYKRILQDFRLHHPHTRIAWNLNYEGFVACIEAVEKLRITAVEFVSRPCHDANAIRVRTIHQLQRDLRLCAELDVVRDVRFFRRAGSFTQSSGRYSCASSRQLNPGAE